MAYATINKPSDYFNTVLYTGNGTTQSITGVGFQPDWTWIKERSSTSGHEVYDSTRGATKLLSPNATDAEGTNASALTSFDNDGFSVGSGGAVNENTQTYVAWNWLANGGTTSSNTDGSITSTVQANTTAGFSIITYTGNGTSGATIGHGLGKVPKMIIQKSRVRTDYNWQVYHAGVSSDPETDFLRLNTTAAVADDATVWNDTAPTSSVITLGNSIGGNANNEDIVVYAFAEIKGYSKFGSYKGNGSADGSLVYTGFKPAWLMIHRIDSAGENWQMFDNKRDGYNVNNDMLKANVAETEDAAGNFLDLLSNGFKLRETAARHNASGGTYIYMAFAENPLVGTNGIPATAR